jgi:hypothetical protein
MNPNKLDSDWEIHLDRRLRELPDRPAPTTLMPRVLAAIRARALPWYKRTWWTWPRGLQILSLVLTSVLLGGITWLALHTGNLGWGGEFDQKLAQWLGPLTALWSVLGVLAEALATIVRSAGTVGLCVAGGVLLTMYLSCVGLGTLFYRVAFSQRSL